MLVDDVYGTPCIDVYPVDHGISNEPLDNEGLSLFHPVGLRSVVEKVNPCMVSIMLHTLFVALCTLFSPAYRRS